MFICVESTYFTRGITCCARGCQVSTCKKYQYFIGTHKLLKNTQLLTDFVCDQKRLFMYFLYYLNKYLFDLNANVIYISAFLFGARVVRVTDAKRLVTLDLFK
jgi:hypothetical protein